MNLFLRATRALLLAVVLLGSAIATSNALAAPGVRANVTYQARLMDASGYPVVDGVYQVRFSLYDAPAAGTRLWTAAGTLGAPTPVNVSVQDGLFTVLLGDGMTQLPFGDLDWNSDSLYLGVTIGADAEMSPRRPITAVPQAINSAQLGGMAPSSTDTYGGQSQFSITQASTTAATSTRSALDVRSNGTSLTNDFILRAITNAGSPAFTITSQGVVSTTNLLVTGQNVCLADGTNCLPSAEFDTLATVTARGSTTTVPLTFFGGATASSLNVTGTAIVSGLVGASATLTAATSTFFNWSRATGNDLIITNATFTQATTTSLAANLVTTTQLFVAGRQVCLQDGTNCSSATTTLQAAYNNGRVLTLNDGKIQLNSVLGSGEDFTFLGADATPVLGAGEAGTPNSGFDLSILNGASTGTLFTFTDNRANPNDPTANTAYIAHVPGLDNTLIIGNATSYIQLDNDIALVASANNQLFFNQGRLEAQGNSDITNTAVYNLVDNCITCSSDIIRLSSGLGQNAIHMIGNTDPNGVVNPFVTSGDLLIRSGSLGGSGTQLYVNVDGTNTGWRGLATTDMLPAGDAPMSLLSENLALVDNFSQIDIEGRLAFVLYNDGNWGIVDISEPGNMVETYHNTGVAAVEGHLVGRRLYLLDANARITVYDFSDPTSQVILGNFDLPDPSMAQNAHFVVEGSVIYLGSDNALLTVDVKDPAAMAVLDDQSPPPGFINYTNIAVQDGFIYFTYKEVGDPNTNILTVDANDPTNLNFFGTIFTPGQDQNDSEVHVSENRLFVKTYNGSEQVINVYRLTAGMVDPSVLTTIDPAGDQIDHFEAYRGRVYTSNFAQDSMQNLFQSFTQNLDGTYSGEQLLQPGIRTTNTSGSPINFAIEGGLVFGAGFDGVNDLLSVLDLGGLTTRSLRATNGDFGQITVANNLNVRGTANFVNGITVDGRGVCLSDGSGCVSTANSSNLDMESHFGGETTIGSMNYIDVEGRVAFVVLDNNDASVYDASWPADQIENRSSFSNMITGKIAGNRLYVLNTSGDLAVLDISDMSSPDFLGALNITSGEDLSFESGAQIAVNGSVLYLSTTNTIRTIDIRDPGAMTVLDAENFADGDVRYPHMAYLDGFIYYAHKEPLNIDNETTVLSAYDVRNPSNISNYDSIVYAGRDRNDTKIAVYNHKIYFQRFTGGEEVIGIRQLNAGMFGSQVATIEPPTSEIGHFEVSNNNVFISGFNEGGPEQNILHTYVSNGNDYDLESTMEETYRTTNDDASPENFDIEGGWLIGGGAELIPGEYGIFAVDLGGLKTRSVFASGGDFGDVIIGNKLMVQGNADFANGVTIQGLSVCLSDGSGCPAAVGGASLQSAYDAGRTISLNDGHVELNGQNGSPTDVTWNGQQYTRLIGGGLSDFDANKGFDIAVHESNPNQRNISLLFSNDRNNPDGIGVMTSQLRSYTSDGSYQQLSMETGDSYVYTSINETGIGFDGSGNGAFFHDSTQFNNEDGHLQVQNYTGNYIAMSLYNNQNGNTVSLKTGSDDPNFNATGTAGDVYYRGGLNGSGTQMYLNVDGTINGWRGVATTDMLSGDEPMSLASTIATTAFSNKVDVQNGKAVSLDFGTNWELFDLSDVTTPVSKYVSTTAMSIGKIVDNRLYMIETNTDILHVFDISDLSLPIVLGTIDLAGGATGDKSIDVVGSTVYVSTDQFTYIVDASTPSAMAIISATATAGSVPLVKAMDGYLYRSAKADNFGNSTTTVTIYDIRNPASPVSLSSFDVTSNVFTNSSLEITENDLFVWGMSAPNATPVINRYNVTDRTNPTLVTQIFHPGTTYWNFAVKNNSIYASNFTGSRCLVRMAYDGTVLEQDCSFNNVGMVAIDGNYAHVAARLMGSGIQTIDLGGKITHGLRASVGDFGHISVKDDLMVGGKAHFTNDISVNGVSVCLADGTNCPVDAAEVDTLASVTARGGTATSSVSFFGGVTTSQLNVTDTANVQYLNASSVAILNGLSASTATFSNAIISDLFAGIGFVGTSTIGFLNVTSSAQFNDNVVLGDAQTDFVAINSRVITNIVPDLNGARTLGLLTNRWHAFLGDVNASNTTSSALSAGIGFFGTSTMGVVNVTSSIQVGGVSVCLANGTNCPVAGASDWTYSSALDLLRTSTSTANILLGAANTSTAGAPAFFDTANAGTSTFYFGFNTNTNVIIGGTSSSVGFMHSQFATNFNGNDLFVAGNIGSASSVYTLGEFVVGTGSFKIGDGTLTKTDGNITVAASSGFILPSTDLGVNLGSAAFRFNNVSANSVSTTGIFVSSTAIINGGLQSTITASTVFALQGSQTHSFGLGIGSELVSVNNIAFFASSTNGSSVALRDVDVFIDGNPQSFITTLQSGNSSIIAADGSGGILVTVQSTSSGLFLSTCNIETKKVYVGNSRCSPQSVAGIGTIFSTSTKADIVVEGGYAYVVDDYAITTFAIGATNTTMLQRLYIGDGVTRSEPIVIGTYLIFAQASTTGGVSLNAWNVDDKTYLTQASNAFFNVDATEISRLNLEYVENKMYLARSTSTGAYINTITVSLPTSGIVYTVNGTTTAGLVNVSGMHAMGNNLFVADAGANEIKIYTRTTTSLPANPVKTISLFSVLDVAVFGKDLLALTPTTTVIYALPGFDVTAGRIGNLGVFELNVLDNLTVSRDVDIASGLSVGAGGIYSRGGIISNSRSDFGPANIFTNDPASTERAWGAYIDQLLVGTYATSSLAQYYEMIINYASTTGISRAGLCLDSVTVAGDCPTSFGGDVSIAADGAVNANAFDLAERFAASGTVMAGDLVQFVDGATSTIEASKGLAYDPRAIGVISTKPGFLLGWDGDAQVALAGRVPVKVTVANGPIRVGDKLTSSSVTGTAMKATRAGMTVGIALQDADADGMVEMFVQPEFSLSSAINTDGSLQFTNESGSTTFSVDAAGNGYFLGDVSATSFTTHGTFDLAERYNSPDQLERGDLVMINPNAEMQMVRTRGDGSLAIGIVSSAPGFTLGAATTDTYPIALAGRVPTKVSNMNGEIKPGDALTVSTLPGVAVKAIDAGMIIGYALQSYNGNDIGLIEVFVQTGYWKPSATYSVATSTSAGPTYQGFAKIMDGATRVHVSFASLLAYPAPVITPMSSMPTVWRLENITDTGFDIVIESNPGMDIVFYWQVNAVPAGIQMSKSDGTTVLVDPLTGQEVVAPAAPVPAEEAESATSTTP